MPPATTLSTSRAPSTARNNLALTAVCLVALMFGLEISSVPVILPTLEQQLGTGFQDAQWIMNAYTLACTSVLMAAGTLADRFGRRRMLVLCLWVFGLASLACGLADSAVTLIVARFVQGIGGGAMMICQFAILSHLFREPAERARAFAIWGVIAGVGLGFGPMVGAVILALADWRWVFLVHVPLTLFTLALLRVSVAESRDPAAHRLDIAGMLTLTLSVFALVYFITQGSEHGFGTPAMLAWAGLAVVGLVLFILVERRSAHPMFDFSVFRIQRFNGALMGSIGMNFSFWPFMIYLPLYFQAGLGYDTLTTGGALLAYTLPTLLVPPLAERLALRYGAERVIPLGLGLDGGGLFGHGCGQRGRTAGYRAGAAQLRDRRGGPGADQLAHHQHHHRLGVGGSRGHGLGHRPQCPADYPGAQHRPDGTGAVAGDQPPTGRNVTRQHRHGLAGHQPKHCRRQTGLGGAERQRRPGGTAQWHRLGHAVCGVGCRRLGSAEPVFFPTRPLSENGPAFAGPFVGRVKKSISR